MTKTFFLAPYEDKVMYSISKDYSVYGTWKFSWTERGWLTAKLFLGPAASALCAKECQPAVGAGAPDESRGAGRVGLEQCTNRGWGLRG